MIINFKNRNKPIRDSKVPKEKLKKITGLDIDHAKYIMNNFVCGPGYNTINLTHILELSRELNMLA